MQRGQARGSGQYHTENHQGIEHSNLRGLCESSPIDKVNHCNLDNKESAYLLFRRVQYGHYLQGELLCAISH